MKKLWKKPFFLPVILVVCYFLGLAISLFTVSAYPLYYKQRDILLQRAQDMAPDLTDNLGAIFDEIAGSDMSLLVYDSNGKCLWYVIPENFFPRTIPQTLPRTYLPTILSGKDVFHLVYWQDEHDIIALAGAPLKEQDSVVGAIFLMRNLKNMPEMFSAFSIYFTIFYWLSICLILSNSHRKRKLEALQHNYIANVTHALKTPIASIKALAETLCDGVEPDPDRQQIYCGMILQEANRQDHMVRDILELSKLQSNGMSFTKTKVPAYMIFDPVLDKYAALCDCMGLSLHVSKNIFYLPPLYTNEACIRQLLEILLDNALKFVHEGGDIWVDATVGRNKVTICVRDNGIGIDKKALPHIFERFYKCNHNFNESGSGLGLAIVQEIISGLKEKIHVESEPDKGSIFFFTVHHK